MSTETQGLNEWNRQFSGEGVDAWCVFACKMNVIPFIELY